MSYAQSWLDMEEASGGRAILKGTSEEMRAMYDALVQSLVPLLPPPSPNVESKDGEVDGIKYRLYWPKSANSPLPTAIWTHGGGLMLGDLNSDDALCRVVAEHTNSAVVSIDYRLTPEHKWPTQLEDSMKVYRWAHKNASSFHGDPNRFYAIGGSAGALLAFSIANQVVNDAELKSSLKGIVAQQPACVHPENCPPEYQHMYKSYTQNAKGTPVIDGESMHQFYKAANADPKDATMFTALATENHAKFPPTYITTCEFDPLRDDGYVMESCLKKAGVPTKLDFYPGFPHYFWIFPTVPESQQYAGNLLQGIGWVLSQM